MNTNQHQMDQRTPFNRFKSLSKPHVTPEKRELRKRTEAEIRMDKILDHQDAVRREWVTR